MVNLELKNAAHLYLPIIALMVEIPLAFELLSFPDAVWATVVTLLAITALAFGYEWKQAMDINIEEKYGSWHSFQIDSRDDMRKDLLGIFLGTVLGAVLRILFLHL